MTIAVVLEVMYLVAVAAVDQWRKTIPVALLLLGAVLAVVLLLSAETPPAPGLAHLMLGDMGRGLVAGAGVLGLVYLGSRVLRKEDGMGMGDVLLGGVLGMMLGPAGVAMALSFAFLAAMGAMFLWPRMFTPPTAFAPYLAAGGIVVLLWGDAMVAVINQHWFA